MAVTQLSDAIPERDNSIVDAVAKLAANVVKSPGDGPSHYDLLLVALAIDERLAELRAAQW